MKNIFLLSIALIFSVLVVNSQTPVKLTGATIGLTAGFNYADNSRSTTINDASKCFDGDLSTFFAAYDGIISNEGEGKGGWLGLDLGSKHVITSIRYAPRPDNPGPERMELGLIEGANNPNFSDAVAIGIIATPAPANQFSTLNINSTKGFRYVRFVGSFQYRTNIAELEFYGYQSEGNSNHIGQLTSLPTVNIHVANNQEINSREVYNRAYFSVIDGNSIVEGEMNIKGRGNASWGFKKKPYRLKFDNSTKLLGSTAKAKNWTLISNEGDKTLIRNLIAFDISEKFEMEYTPFGKLVDVVVNGDYRGCYQLCDHIDVREGRVDINEMKATDISNTAITGGYLIQIDAYAYDDPTSLKFSSNRGVPVTMKNPDEDVAVQAQQDYIKHHFNAWETSVTSSNYTDPNSGFRAFTDIESFCRHFLIGELAGNTDTYWSVYMVKKRNNDKFFFYPVWDNDLAFENDNRTHPIMQKTAQNQDQWLYQWGGSSANNVKPLINRLLTDADLYQRMKDIWAQYRNSGAISAAALVQTIDNYAAQINVSQDLNFKRWDNLYNYEHEMWGRGDYTNNINIVKDYVAARLAWMDTKLNYVPSNIAHTRNQNFNLYSDNNKLNISNLTEKTDIVCFDLAGKKIFETSAESSFEKQLPQGVYIVQLTTKNNYLGSFKIVIGVMP